MFNFFKDSQPQPNALPLFDEAFLRRLERLSYRTAPTLRGGTLGERRSRNLRPSLDFSDHRPYSTGDDLRYVDWQVYARHEELFVKLGETTQSVHIHILLDRSRSVAWSPWQKPKASKWDAARRLAGALGYLALAGGERLTITPFAVDLDESFGPTRGKRQVIAALRFLSEVTPAAADGESDLARSLKSYAKRYAPGGVLILISDLLDTAVEGPTGAWLAEGLNYLAPPRWQVMVMHVLSEEEIDPPLQGDVELRDVETGRRLPFRLNERTVNQYRQRAQQWLSRVESVCAQRRATYARVMAEWPFEQAVVPYLRQRGVVQ